jgi:alpha-methylacyl-CoA racemase
MFLALGAVAALLHARATGEGQVVDAAIVDGTAHLNSMTLAFLAGGLLREQRASNLLDGGAPFYDLYETADAKHLAVGALEPQFYAELLAGLGIADVVPDRDDPANHPELRQVIADAVRRRTQAEWVEVFDGTDACVAPVLPLTEAFHHPHLAARGTYVERDGVTEPAPAPRFSRTAPSLTTPPPARPGLHTVEALAAWGVADVDRLLASGAAVQAE